MAAPRNRPSTHDRPAGWGPRLLTIGLPLLVVIILTAVNYPAMRAVVVGTVGSTRALLIVAGIIALTLGWSAVLRKVVPNPWVRSALVLVPVAVVSGLYVAPYFGGDTVVDDEFPVALTGADAAETPSPDDEEKPDPSAPPTTPPRAPTPVATLADGADPAEAATQADAATPEAPSAAVPSTPPVPETAAQQSGPVELGRGAFVGLDGHYANGQAALYDVGDGTQIVRLEEVDLQPVPEPVVYLVPVADADVVHPGSVNLGPLRGNMGNQNYDIPADVDLATGDWSVLVWCEIFASPVGTATQT